MADGISPAEFDFVSQNGHDLAGILAVLAPLALIGPQWYWRAGGAAALLLFAAVKEFWYDEIYETPNVRGSSLEDFLHYVIPCAIMFALSCIDLWGRALL